MAFTKIFSKEVVAMATKKKLQAMVVEIPTSIKGVDVGIRKIARIQNEIDSIAQDYAEKILALQEEAKMKISPLKKNVDSIFTGIYAYCSANRPALLDKGRKTIDLPSGTICWRYNPPSVLFKHGLKIADVIAILKKKRLGKFVRVKHEINKEAILLNPDAVAKIPEIRIVQEETFNVKPNDLKTEITGNPTDLQKALPSER